MAGLGFPELLIISVIIALNLFWLWALVDCMANEPARGLTKIVWVLVILCTHLFGA
jgi:hypothetical protein